MRSRDRNILCVLLLGLVLAVWASRPGLSQADSAAQSETQGKPAQTPPQQKPQPPPPQSAPPKAEQDEGEPVRLGARLVMVPVSATDVAGQPVKDLKAEEVVIEEEGRPQQVVALGEPGKTPVDIALLFDVSGSTNAQFAFEQQAAVQFIHDVLKPGDSVSLFSIGVTPKLVKARTTSGEEVVLFTLDKSPLFREAKRK